MSSYANATTDFPVYGLLAATTGTFPTATIQSILDAVSSGEVDTVIQKWTALPINGPPYNTGLVMLVCQIGALEVMTMRGFNPESPNDVAIVERAERARALLKSYQESDSPPPWLPTTPPMAVTSDISRGWYFPTGQVPQDDGTGSIR